MQFSLVNKQINKRTHGFHTVYSNSFLKIEEIYLFYFKFTRSYKRKAKQKNNFDLTRSEGNIISDQTCCVLVLLIIRQLLPDEAQSQAHTEGTVSTSCAVCLLLILFFFARKNLKCIHYIYVLIVRLYCEEKKIYLKFY